MVTSQRSDFIAKEYDLKTYTVYNGLNIGASQADFWRLLVLYRYGGVYMDIDAHLVCPMCLIIKPHFQELYIKIKSGEISNYFIASKPNNPNTKLLIDKSIDNIWNMRSENVYSLTGPGVFNEIFAELNVPTRYYLYTCNQGNFTNEYFQYVDKRQGKWTREQERTKLINKTW